jgi:N-acyl-D-amino-acid deacylase
LRMNRGRLKTGLPADVTVFDPDKVSDLVSQRMPAKLDDDEVLRHPPGIGAVVVNGKVVLQQGEFKDVFPGRVRRQELFIPGQ